MFWASAEYNCTSTNNTNTTSSTDTDVNRTCNTSAWVVDAQDVYKNDDKKAKGIKAVAYDCFMTLEAIDAALTKDDKMTAEKKEEFQQRLYEALDSIRNISGSVKSACKVAETLDREYGKEEGLMLTPVKTEEEENVTAKQPCPSSKTSRSSQSVE